VRPPFVREDLSSMNGKLTDLGCPDCRGVLAVSERRPDGKVLVFTCQIGHRYSPESLIESKEEQLEEALWTTIETLDEIAMLHTDLSPVSGDHAAAFEARARLATEHAATLRRLVQRDRPVSLDDPAAV
jgi:two-component system chemotaxis response regulator CheB